MLAVPVHSPAFLFERTTESEGGDVVEYVLRFTGETVTAS